MKYEGNKRTLGNFLDNFIKRHPRRKNEARKITNKVTILDIFGMDSGIVPEIWFGVKALKVQDDWQHSTWAKHSKIESRRQAKNTQNWLWRTAINIWDGSPKWLFHKVLKTSIQDT